MYLYVYLEPSKSAFGASPTAADPPGVAGDDGPFPRLVHQDDENISSQKRFEPNKSEGFLRPREKCYGLILMFIPQEESLLFRFI